MANRSSTNGTKSVKDDLYSVLDPLYSSSDPLSTWNNYGDQSFLSQIPIFGQLFNSGVGNWLNSMLGQNDDDARYRQQRLSQDQQRLAIELNRENNANELANTYMANMMEKQRADEYNENQIRLQQQANQFNLEQWNRANQYNSPSAVIQRYAAAGINPNFAFNQGSSVAPVQQTSLPDQSRAGVAKADFDSAKLPSLRDITSRHGVAEMFDFLKGLISQLPGSVLQYAQAEKLRADARGVNLDNEKREIDNEIAARNLEGRRDADEQFKTNNSIINLETGDVISQSDYDKLSPDEQKPYQNEVLDRDGNKEMRPNYLNLFFTTAEGYEAWQKVRNISNFVTNVNADNLRSKLQIAISKHQLEDKTDDGKHTVAYVLAHMPDKQYNMLVQSYRKLSNENSWSEEDRDIEKEILGLSLKQLKSSVDHDFFNYIDKIGNKDMTAADFFKMFLVGLHDALSGVSSFRKAFGRR